MIKRLREALGASLRKKVRHVMLSTSQCMYACMQRHESLLLLDCKSVALLGRALQQLYA
jgi:hypothetical protein